MNDSLRKKTRQFAREYFPDVFIPQRTSIRKEILDFINDSKTGLFVFPITLLVFVIVQCLPDKHAIFHIKSETANGIVDQRVSNLATIFSITLVVIGWLITNISSKEFISYKLLFRKTYLYPIFYFVVSIIICLIVASLFKDVACFDMGDIVLSGTFLIIVALILIVFVFKQLIKVVDSAFFLSSMKEMVIAEYHEKARDHITWQKSRKIYDEVFTNRNFHPYKPFWFGLNNYKGFNLTPHETTQQAVLSFASEKDFRVHDVKINKLSEYVATLDVTNPAYFQALHLDEVIHENHYLFFIQNNVVMGYDIESRFKEIYCLKKPRKEKKQEKAWKDYLDERLLKEVEDGKVENVLKCLEVYTMIFDLENKITNLC
jgi:hypothetical protein